MTNGNSGAKVEKLNGAGSKGENCKRSREQGPPPLTEALHLNSTIPSTVHFTLSVTLLMCSTNI